MRFRAEHVIELLQSLFVWKLSETMLYGICLTIRAKMIGGGLLLPKILGQSDRVGAKSPIFYIFSLVAPQP